MKFKHRFINFLAFMTFVVASGCAVDEAALKKSVTSAEKINESDIQLVSHGYLTVNEFEKKPPLFEEGEFVFTRDSVFFYKGPISNSGVLDRVLHIKFDDLVKAGVMQNVTSQIQLIEENKSVGIQLFDQVIIGDKSPENTARAFDLVINSGVAIFEPTQPIEDGRDVDYGTFFQMTDFLYQLQ